MAKDQPKSVPADGWRKFVPFVGLVGAVVGVLILGAMLRSGVRDPLPVPERRPPSDEAKSLTPGPSGRAQDHVPPTLPASTTPDPPQLNELARRAQSDLDRLSSSRQAWTLKLATVCDPANAQRWLDQVGDESKLFFVPILIDDRACFRLSWGRFDSRDRAAAARLPAALRSFAAVEPSPSSVEQILR